MKQGRPRHSGQARSGAPNRSKTARTNYANVGKQGVAGSIPPSIPINPKNMPVENKPPPTDARWAHTMGVPSMNPSNPYEGSEDVNG